MAKKYPNVDVPALRRPLWTKETVPENVGSYFGYIDECEYLSGIVAGYATKTKKLGFVAAKPIPQVLRNINAFTLGHRSVDPKIDVHRDLHRRLVQAGQGSRGDQQPASTRAWTSSPATSTAPRWSSKRAERRGIKSAATTPARRTRAQGLPHRRRVELGEGLHRLRQRCQGGQEDPQPRPRRPEGEASSRCRPTAGPVERRGQEEAADESRTSS